MFQNITFSPVNIDQKRGQPPEKKVDKKHLVPLESQKCPLRI